MNDSLKNIILFLYKYFFYAHHSKYDNLDITINMVKEGLPIYQNRDKKCHV